MKTPEMDLLDLCACRLGCQYLSDLRGLQGAAGPAGRGPAGRGGGGGPLAGVERRFKLPDWGGPRRLAGGSPGPAYRAAGPGGAPPRLRA